MKLIPAIDLLNGKCVRLTQGDYKQVKEYDLSPDLAVKIYENAGLKNVHIVDLDGAKSKKVVNWGVITQIREATKMNIDFGGGVKSTEDVQRLLNLGINELTVGSIATSNPELVFEWMDRFGAEHFILGADCLDERIRTNGWQNDSGINVFEFIEQFASRGLSKVICTDVSKDGMLNGPSLDLYKKILSRFDIALIASGGVSSMNDIFALSQIGCSGVIIGKAIYEGKITLNELKEYA